MSQRNPMNARYTSDEHAGVTRKSAAKAKPKMQAASTVTIKEPSQMTPKEKKAARRAEEAKARQKEAELNAKYARPNTPEYKKWRKFWWIGIISAIALVLISWLTRSIEPYWISLGILGVAYVAIIFAFWVDLVKIRKITRKYAKEMYEKDEAEKKKRYKGLSKKQIAEIEATEAKQRKEAMEAEKQARKDKLMFWKKKSTDTKETNNDAESNNENENQDSTSEEK